MFSMLSQQEKDYYCRYFSVLGLCSIILCMVMFDETLAQQRIDDDFGFNVVKLMNETIEQSRSNDPNPSIREMCYNSLGCFNKDTGLMRHIGLLPMPPRKLNTKYLLYKRNMSDTYLFINPENPGTFAGIDRHLPVVIIIHGFAENSSSSYFIDVKDALFEKENVTVIMIDYTNGAKAPDYVLAALTSELVGRQTAVLMKTMMDHLKISADKFHLVGFSLGAQVAGFASKWLMKNHNIKIGRITGLDPASPLFEDYGENIHLNPSDADFVDVIHTSAGDAVVSGQVGMKKPVGHVDFYPNGGKQQPGCSKYVVGCGHQRSVRLFAASISPRCNFVAYPCESYEKFKDGKCTSCGPTGCGMMGYYSDQAPGRGIFYLDTGSKKPYCLENVIKEEGLPDSAYHMSSSLSSSLFIISTALWITHCRSYRT